MNNLVDSISFEYGNIKVTFFGMVEIEKEGTPIDWHRHSYYELHIFDDFCKYKFNDKSISFKKGEFVIIPPYVTHNTVTDADYSAKAVAFTFSKVKSNLHFFEKVTKDLESKSLIPFTMPDVSAEDLILLGNTEFYSSLHGICKLKATASKIICSLFKTLVDDIVFVNDCHESMLVVIDNLINIPDFTLSDIAKITSYSERQISRIISKHYGLTLSELRRRIKADNRKGE